MKNDNFTIHDFDLFRRRRNLSQSSFVSFLVLFDLLFPEPSGLVFLSRLYVDDEEDPVFLSAKKPPREILLRSWSYRLAKVRNKCTRVSREKLRRNEVKDAWKIAKIDTRYCPKRHDHPDPVGWVFKRPDVYGILRFLRVQQASYRPFQRQSVVK